jgi:DNA-binding response OmpR family regulator
VHDAASVADALRVFGHVKPDLVVLDMQLPDGNGFDVLEHIRSRGDVPTLFDTAATGIEDRVAALDRGADDYLLKPFSPEELVAPADAALRRHVTAAAHRAGHGWRSDPPAAP